MEIARQRVGIRGVNNRLTWVQNKIENIPVLKLGNFDYIESTGVLHHLPDPQQGLGVLAESLKETGGLNMMVYARLGRTGVYQMQELVKIINEEVRDKQKEVQNVLHILHVMMDVHRVESVSRRLMPTYGKETGDGSEYCNPQLSEIKKSMNR